jgi:cytochrome c-type biogenesis protein CcmH/NrfF
MARHGLDPLSLLFGLLFAAGGLAVLGGDPAGGTVGLGWVGPVVALGLGGLVVAAARPRRPARPVASDAAGDESASTEVETA